MWITHLLRLTSNIGIEKRKQFVCYCGTRRMYVSMRPIFLDIQIHKQHNIMLQVAPVAIKLRTQNSMFDTFRMRLVINWIWITTHTHTHTSTVATEVNCNLGIRYGRAELNERTKRNLITQRQRLNMHDAFSYTIQLLQLHRIRHHSTGSTLDGREFEFK